MIDLTNDAQLQRVFSELSSRSELALKRCILWLLETPRCKTPHLDSGEESSSPEEVLDYQPDESPLHPAHQYASSDKEDRGRVWDDVHVKNEFPLFHPAKSEDKDRGYTLDDVWEDMQVKDASSEDADRKCTQEDIGCVWEDVKEEFPHYYVSSDDEHGGQVQEGRRCVWDDDEDVQEDRRGVWRNVTVKKEQCIVEDEFCMKKAGSTARKDPPRIPLASPPLIQPASPLLSRLHKKVMCWVEAT